MITKNRFKITELDYKHTDLYHMFDELILPIKSMYLQCFEENYKNEYEKQNAKKQQIIRPKEIEFEKEIENTLTQYKQENTNEKFTIMYEDRNIINKPNNDQQLLYESFVLSQVQQEKLSSKSKFRLLHNSKERRKFYLCADQHILVKKIQTQKNDIWQIIKNNDDSQDVQCCDVILNGKQQIMTILSKFQIMNQPEDDQWQTIETFPDLKNDPKVYKYEIGEKEIRILTNLLQLNSNIINAYTNYLMREDEKHYFSLKKVYRSKYRRLFIFNTEFITDCGIDINSNLQQEQLKQKYLYFFLKYLDNFKCIQYNFQLIYKQIGFVVNLRNDHCYLVQVMLQQKLLVIYHSIQRTEDFYNNVKDLLEYLFREITKDENLTFKICFAQEFPQQKDKINCGYYTCVAANYLSQCGKLKFLNLNDLQDNLKKLFLSYQQVKISIFRVQELLDDEFPHQEKIYPAILSKYKTSLGTQNIVIITSQGTLLLQHETFKVLSSMDQPILNIFGIADILELNNKFMNFPQDKEIEWIPQNLLEGKIKHSYMSNYQKGENQQSIKNQKEENNDSVSQLSIDQSRIMQSKDFIEQIIQSKNKEIENLQQISQIIEDEHSQQSIAVSQFGQCQFCDRQIDSNIIQLSCQHYYHDECFNTLLQAQIIKGCIQFQCLCNIKIRVKELYLLQNKFSSQIYQLQLYQNQLNQLQQRYRVFSYCDRPDCTFFFVNNRQFNERMYCPICNND